MSCLLASKANLVHNSFLVYLFLVHLSNSTCFGRLRVVYVRWGCYSFYRGFSGYSFYGWLICLKVYTPLTSSSLIVSNFVLCGTPFLAGFYSRDLFSKCFLWVMWTCLVSFCCLYLRGLTVCYSSRLFYFVLNETQFIPLCIPDSHPHRITSTKCHINTVVSPDNGHIVAQKVQRLIDILRINILRRNRALNFLYLQAYARMHGQQT